MEYNFFVLWSYVQEICNSTISFVPCHISALSPLSFLLQEVGEVIALVHIVHMFAFLSIQLIDSAPVAFLCQQELFQHTAV